MKTREIADLVGGELRGDGDIEINSVADISTARSGQIAFFDKNDPPPPTAASCVIASSPDEFTNITIVLVKNPKLEFARVASVLHPPKTRSAEIHSSAVISPRAKIGKNVFVGAFVCVGDDSIIGDDSHLRAGAKIGDNVTVGVRCVIHPNVLIDDGCSVGDNVVLHSGVVIGADGFGYVRDEHEYVKFPQIGTVVLESNVEIGANSCVDRGALGETRIGEGTKLDNLVQVGHNVQIGKRCVIAAQTGISGSVVIEDDCVIGGQVGFGDHVRVLSGSVIGAQAGVLPGKIVRPGVWWGTPIQPLDEYKRQNAHVKGLERLKKEIKEIRSLLASLSSKDKS